jgi:hypothetical protein
MHVQLFGVLLVKITKVRRGRDNHNTTDTTEDTKWAIRAREHQHGGNMFRQQNDDESGRTLTRWKHV